MSKGAYPKGDKRLFQFHANIYLQEALKMKLKDT